MRWQSGREGRLAQEVKEKENKRKECNGAGVKFFGLMGFGNPGRVLTHLVNTGRVGIFKWGSGWPLDMVWPEWVSPNCSLKQKKKKKKK